jgi:hypothetical protein
MASPSLESVGSRFYVRHPNPPTTLHSMPPAPARLASSTGTKPPRPPARASLVRRIALPFALHGWRVSSGVELRFAGRRQGVFMRPADEPQLRRRDIQSKCPSLPAHGSTCSSWLVIGGKPGAIDSDVEVCSPHALHSRAPGGASERWSHPAVLTLRLRLCVSCGRPSAKLSHSVFFLSHR